MFRLDYISCLLTVLSTILVSRRMWQGWIVASANSVLICVIGFRTAQLGFIPANLFCLALYMHAIYKWKSTATAGDSHSELCSATLERDGVVEDAGLTSPARASVRFAEHRLRSRVSTRASAGDEQSARSRDRIRSRNLSARS